MNDTTVDSRKRWHPRTPSLSGLAVAAVFFWLSFTPSLLPVPWLYQGLATGVSVALGYAIGAFIGWVVRALAGRPIPHRVMRWAWLALAVAGPIVLIVAVIQGHAWLNEMERLVQMPEAGVATTLSAAVAGLVVALILVGLARLVRDLAVWAARLLGRWVRWRAALAIG
ncbi:MAG: alpha/beta-hydrolase N-terminal domain-containing protein, partial [Actinomycetes bacterium]